MPCPCCDECVTDEDCPGCGDPSDTYYPEVDGCCQEGSYPKDGTGGCWEGTPGTETARIPYFGCCDGQCLEHPCPP
jgi:hypothetical protein